MCTTFSIKRNNDTLIGRTMDLQKYHKYEFKYFPKNYNYEDDAFGKKLYIKYKIMGTTFQNYEHLLDGINEKGILGCTNLFKNVITFPDEQKKDKINLTSTKLLNVFLTNCATLDEIRELANKIYVVKKSFVDENNFSRHYHYMFSDKDNNSIVIEIDNGNLIVHENKYNIMTNSPKFETHMKNLEKYIEKPILKGSPITPTKRFLRAYDELKNIKNENSNKNNVDIMFESLKKFKVSESDIGENILKIPSITLYYSVISSKEKIYYIRYTDSTEINKITFDDFENSEHKKIIQFKK